MKTKEFIKVTCMHAFVKDEMTQGKVYDAEDYDEYLYRFIGDNLGIVICPKEFFEPADPKELNHYLLRKVNAEQSIYIELLKRQAAALELKLSEAKLEGLPNSISFTFKKEIMRRNNLWQNIVAEKAIRRAVHEIEVLAADVRLTNAVILLDKARNLVADYVDDIPYSAEQSKTPNP